MGIEPIPTCLQGTLAALVHAPPFHPSVAEVGVEPTDNHQALDLAALPGLRTRPFTVAAGVSARQMLTVAAGVSARRVSSP
jgi:hypothetical protein